MIDVNLAYIDSADKKLRVVATPYEYAIAEGILHGHEIFQKLGYQPVTAAAQYCVWNVAADYVVPATPIQMEVYSSDNTNDKAGGTGALTLRIDYLDGNFKEKYEVVAPNGTTAVPTVATDIYRVNRFRLNTAGTLGAAAGTISLRAVADTPIYDQIAVAFSQSRTLFYTVPANKTLYITSIFASSAYSTAGKQIIINLKSTYDTYEKRQTSGRFFLPNMDIVLVDSSVNIPLSAPMIYPATTDIKAVVSGETNAKVSLCIRGWIE